MMPNRYLRSAVRAPIIYRYWQPHKILCQPHILCQIQLAICQGRMLFLHFPTFMPPCGYMDVAFLVERLESTLFLTFCTSTGQFLRIYSRKFRESVFFPGILQLLYPLAFRSLCGDPLADFPADVDVAYLGTWSLELSLTSQEQALRLTTLSYRFGEALGWVKGRLFILNGQSNSHGRRLCQYSNRYGCTSR
ncbi:hypothetical protein CPC08DRAFT_29675 [Agrocybe pediades]|nr:hypothetical protein CPC08DRAFT_29675 [Agrocybe pediades]